MFIQLSTVMRRGDIIKLTIVIFVGIIAFAGLYREYQKTEREYEGRYTKIIEQGRT